MEDQIIYKQIETVKSKLQKMIEQGFIPEAEKLLDQLYEAIPDDPDICSMRSVIHIIKGDYDKAESVLTEGLKKDTVQYDMLFNLAYIYDMRKMYQKAADYYYKARTVAVTDEQKQNITLALEKITAAGISSSYENKERIVFLVKEGIDSFLDDIIQGLDGLYCVRKVVISNLKKIDICMEWADICWFEWCDELVAYGSNLLLAGEKRIICRLHSYEAFTDFINKVKWVNINKLVFVAEHIRNYVLGEQPLLRPEQTVVIPNGIDTARYTFNKRAPGFNIAYVGYINYKKGPMLLLHTFKAIYDRDRRYKLYIAGKFQDKRDQLYYDQMTREFGIENNVIFDGWQNDLDQWLKDKNYILCTSILESQNISVMQAMCKGIKPVIHNFVGAKSVYPERYVWNTMDEAVKAVLNSDYDSDGYRGFIMENYSIEKSLRSIKDIIQNSLSNATDNGNTIAEFGETIRKLTDRYLEIKDAKPIPKYSHSNGKSKISIITPMYNAGIYIGELFESIAEQTISTDIEWIIEDDCSKDGSLEICIKLAKQYAERIGSIRIYSLERNSGASYALHCAAEKCSSDYIAWISADDLYVSVDKLETDYNILQNKQADYVFSENICTGSNYHLGDYGVTTIPQNILGILNKSDIITKLALLTYVNPINGSSLVFRKSLYDKCGGFDSNLCNYDSDWDMHYKVILNNGGIVTDNKCIFYRTHASQTSANNFGMLAGSSVTRLRMLKTIEGRMQINEFVGSLKSLGIFSENNFMIRPVVSYFLLKYCGLGKDHRAFMKSVEAKYGMENLNHLDKLSDKISSSNSYEIFLNSL